MNNGLRIEWSSWTLHTPKDVPLQSLTNNNCGVHLCVWAHLIISGGTYSFSESDMIQARKWIFDRILQAEKQYKEFKFESERINKTKSNRSVNKAQINHLQKSENPPCNAESTVLFCQSLKHMWN